MDATGYFEAIRQGDVERVRERVGAEPGLLAALAARPDAHRRDFAGVIRRLRDRA